MARLTRKLLKALGVEDESKIDEIIEAHTETVDALKNERDIYKAEAEQYKEDAGKLADVQKELNELKQDRDSYEPKYKLLQQEFADYKTGIENEKITAKKTAAYKALLKDAGISEKRLDAILKVSSDAIQGIELDENGEISGVDSISEKVKEEWSDFIETSGTKGAEVSTPPGNGIGGAGFGLSRAAQVAMKHNQNVWGASPKEEE